MSACKSIELIPGPYEFVETLQEGENCETSMFDVVFTPEQIQLWQAGKQQVAQKSDFITSVDKMITAKAKQFVT